MPLLLCCHEDTRLHKRSNLRKNSVSKTSMRDRKFLLISGNILIFLIIDGRSISFEINRTKRKREREDPSTSEYNLEIGWRRVKFLNSWKGIEKVRLVARVISHELVSRTKCPPLFFKYVWGLNKRILAEGMKWETGRISCSERPGSLNSRWIEPKPSTKVGLVS